MKKPKGQWKENLTEGIVELVFCLVLFGLGALVIGLFGVSADDVDGDLLIIIGLGAVVVLYAVVCGIENIKKRKKTDSETNKNDE